MLVTKLVALAALYLFDVESASTNSIMPKNNLSRKVDGSGTTMLVVLKLGILVRFHTSLIKIAGLLQPPSC